MKFIDEQYGVKSLEMHL